MKYDPKDASNCIPAGLYEASIRAVFNEKDDGTPLVTRSGEEMQKIVWDVYTDKGTRQFTEYHAGGNMLWRYKRLAQALGAEDAFKKGEFDAKNFEGENVQLELTVKESEQYGDQNQVKAYTAKAGPPKGAPKQPAKPGVNAKGVPADPTASDDIPF